MANEVGEVFIKVSPEVSGFQRDLERKLKAPAEAAATTAGKAAGDKFSRGITDALTAVGAFAVARKVGQFFSSTVDSAVEFESAFAGVRKTVDASEAEFGALEEQFRNLSKEIPASAAEIAGVAEVAGQLGIAAGDIAAFTETAIALGVATPLSAEAAATGLARLANITGLPTAQIENLGSALVQLGNVGASTEDQILDVATRIAGAGKIAGLAEAEILAIGGALGDVGIDAERGGTAVQKVLIGITQAVAEGNEDLAVFARVAGQSSEQFAESFRTDAAGAFASFVEGLGRQGNQAFGILEELNLADQRLISTFLALGGAGELLGTRIGQANVAFEENTALTEEAEKRYATNAAQLARLRNVFDDVKISIGGVVAGGLIPILEVLAKLPAPVIATGAAFVGLAATGIGLIRLNNILSTVGLNFGRIAQTIKVNFAVIKAVGVVETFKGLGAAIAGLSTAGAIAGAAAAVAAAGLITYNKVQGDAAKNAGKLAKQLTGEAIPAFLKTGKIIPITAHDTEQLGKIFGSTFSGGQRQAVKETFEALNSGAISGSDALKRLAETAKIPFEDFKSQIQGIAFELARTLHPKDFDDFGAAASRAFDLGALSAEELSKGLLAAGFSQNRLNALLNAIPDAKLRGLVAAEIDTAEAAKIASEELDKQGDSVSEVREAFDAATESLKEWASELELTLGRTLSQQEATDAYFASLNDLREGLEESGGAIRGQSEAALENRANLRGLVEDTLAMVEANQRNADGTVNLDAVQRNQIARLKALKEQFPGLNGFFDTYIQNIKDAQAAGDVETAVDLIVNTTNAPAAARFFAAGGLIPMTGLQGGGLIHAQGGRLLPSNGTVIVGEDGIELGDNAGGGAIRSNDSLLRLLEQLVARIGGTGQAPIIVNEVSADPEATARAVAARIAQRSAR